MQFRKVQALRGPNVWASFPVLEAWVDLGALQDSSSDAMPGFNDRLMGWLPGLIEHRCSVGQRGGFLERLRRGTYLAHILEHVTLELQTLAGTEVGFGRTRQANEDGVYKVAVQYEQEELGRACLEAARQLCLAAVENTPLDVAAEVGRLRELARRGSLPPGLASVVAAARRRDIPVLTLDGAGLVQLGYGARQRRVLDGRIATASAVTEAVALDNERVWNLLYAAGLPVPEGRVAASAADAWDAAQEQGGPVVLKPRSGNRRRGSGSKLSTREEILAAYEAAAPEGGPVLVERFVAGADWRLLVVGERVVGAVRRELGRTPAIAVDVTDEVHPESAARAVDAAQVLGLDVAGVDVVARDIRLPLEAQGGAIVAVTPRPRLGLHLQPTEGSARPVGEAVLQHLFPEGQTGRIPTVAVTGTNGKTTTIRLVAHVLGRVYRKVGMTCTEGIYIGGRRIASGDCSGPQSARTVLQDPRVEAAVLETARGGILRAGLGFDRCDVGVVTNVGEGDHLGAAEVDTPEQLAWVKSTVVAAVAPHGAAVLNAADPLVVGMARWCRGRVVYFARSDDHPVVTAHRAGGGRAVFVRDNAIVLADGGREEVLTALERVPLTHGGRIGFHVENALAATAALWSLGVPLDVVRAGLEGFAADLDRDPGRFNLLEINGATVILDYGHNADALLALVRSLEAFPQRRRAIVYSSSGDRRDADLVRQGEILGHSFDRVILYEDPRYLRGRQEGGITGPLRAGLAGGSRVGAIEEVRSWQKAAELALESVAAGEVLVLQPDVIDETVEFVRRYLDAGEGREIGLAEALEATDPQPDSVVYPADHSGVEVRAGRLGHGACATRPFAPGETVLRAWGELTPQRLRETMQVDVDTHVIPPPPLRYFNHSCEPNCGALIRSGVREIVIRALRPVEAGEELTLDYATFEYEVGHVHSECLCGTPSCRGRVVGYKYLSREMREAYGEYVAEYLREMEQAVAVRRAVEKTLVAGEA